MSGLRLAAALALVVAAGGCGAPDDEEPPEAPPGPAWALPSNVTVRLDPRVELLSAVQALADGRESAHPAVRRYRAWRAAGVPAAAPMQALLLASTAYEIVDAPESEPWATGKLGGPGAVRAFVSELKDFDRASGFEKYFASRSSENAVAVAEAVAEIRRGIPIGRLEAYLGARFTGRFLLIPAPGYRGDGTVMALHAKPGLTTHVRFRGPRGRYQLALLGDSLAHELAHQIVRPPRAETARLDAALGPPPASCSGGPDDGGWTECLEEHVVMGVEIRLLELAGAAPKPDFPGGAFPYLPAVLDALREYEASRGRYPTLASFYPRLADAVIRAGKR